MFRKKINIQREYEHNVHKMTNNAFQRVNTTSNMGVSAASCVRIVNVILQPPHATHRQVFVVEDVWLDGKDQTVYNVHVDNMIKYHFKVWWPKVYSVHVVLDTWDLKKEEIIWSKQQPPKNPKTKQKQTNCPIKANEHPQFSKQEHTHTHTHTHTHYENAKTQLRKNILSKNNKHIIR